jgi:hypothetical protein
MYAIQLTTRRPSWKRTALRRGHAPDGVGSKTLAAWVGRGVRIVLLTAEIGPAELLRAVQLGGPRELCLKEAATTAGPRSTGFTASEAGQYLNRRCRSRADQGHAPSRRPGHLPARPLHLTARELEIVQGHSRRADNNREHRRPASRISLQTVSSITSRASFTKSRRGVKGPPGAGTELANPPGGSSSPY